MLRANSVALHLSRVLSAGRYQTTDETLPKYTHFFLAVRYQPWHTCILIHTNLLEGAVMDATIIRDKAKSLGIKTARKKSDDLIKLIQEAEGNFPCFKTASDSCDQTGCLWRSDCLSTK